jgi:hypothetical protein
LLKTGKLQMMTPVEFGRLLESKRQQGVTSRWRRQA